MNINGFVILLIFLSANFICLYLVWKEKIKVGLISIILLGTFLRIFVSLDNHLHEWDEKYHALVAKNTAKHFLKPTLYETIILKQQNYSWQNCHVWLHKQPVTIWLIAVCLKIFGNFDFVVRIPSIILSVLAMFVLFQLAKEFYSKKVALMSVYFFSINGLFVEMSGGRVPTDHIDICFSVMFLISTYFAVLASKYQNWSYLFLFGIFLGLSVLTKWIQAFLVIPIWMIFELHFKNRNILLLSLKMFFVISVSFFIFYPWHYYSKINYPFEYKIEAFYNWKHIYFALESHEKPWYFYLDNIRIFCGELVYIPLSWLLYKVITNFKYEFGFLAIWIFVPLLFFSSCATKMPAYCLFSFPAVFLVCALFLEEINSIKLKRSYSIFLGLISTLLILLPIRYCIERVKFFDSDNQYYSHNIRHQNNLKENSVIFNSNYPIEEMFYNDCTAYNECPNDSILLTIHKQNATIYFHKFRLNFEDKARIAKLGFVEFLE